MTVDITAPVETDERRQREGRGGWKEQFEEETEETILMCVCVFVCGCVCLRGSLPQNNSFVTVDVSYSSGNG